MKLFVKIALTILFFILLYLASENSAFFGIFLVLFPIIAIVTIVIKFKNFNNINHKNPKTIPKADKSENIKKEEQKDSTE